MYAEAGLLFPYCLQSFPQDIYNHLQPQARLDDELLYRIHATTIAPHNHHDANTVDSHCQQLPFMSPGNIMVQTSTVSEYDLGGEGDLFKAPEPIIEEPVLDLDPMTAAISMLSSGEDLTAAEAIKVADIESMQTEHLLDEVFYECKKDLLAKSAIEEQFSELSDVKISAFRIEDDQSTQKDRLVPEGPMQKSISSGCLTSMEWINTPSTRPNFLDFQGMDLGTALGMRRAYSEGDIQALGYGNTSLVKTSIVHAPFDRLLTIGNQKIEERRQKLSRYRKKKSKRNFGRRIKYACRKALADSQPRVRGRFAKTEESEVAKPFK